MWRRPLLHGRGCKVQSVRGGGRVKHSHSMTKGGQNWCRSHSVAWQLRHQRRMGRRMERKVLDGAILRRSLQCVGSMGHSPPIFVQTCLGSLQVVHPLCHF